MLRLPAYIPSVPAIDIRFESWQDETLFTVLLESVSSLCSNVTPRSACGSRHKGAGFVSKTMGKVP